MYNVKHKDKYRVQVVEGTRKNSNDEGTKTITTYFIKKPKNGNVDYDITFIDTVNSHSISARLTCIIGQNVCPYAIKIFVSNMSAHKMARG